ncbi:MAG: hypothetical protein ACI35S_04785 [Anaeroplasma sp.]
MQGKYFDLGARIIDLIFVKKKKSQSEIKSLIDINFDKITKNTNIDDNFNEINKIDEMELNDNIIILFIRYLYSLDISIDDEDIEFCAYNGKPLNTINTDTVEIYSSYTSINRNSNGLDSVFSLFQNMIIFVKNNFFRKDVKLISTYIDMYHKEIKIAYCPYSNVDLDYELNETGCYFPNRCRISKDDYHYINKIKFLANEKRCNIIFGPEVNGSKALSNIIKKYCNDVTNLIISPSYHYSEDGKTYNQTDIFTYQFDHRKKETIYKNFPAVTSKFIEGINSDIRKIIVININGIGRLGILICKDFLEKVVNELIEELNLDIVIVQSYSLITSDFIDRIPQFSMYKRLLIVGNSCSSLDKNNDNIVNMHIGNYTNEHSNNLSKTILYNTECNDYKNCNSNYCYFIINCKKKDEKFVIKFLSFDDNKIKVKIINREGKNYEI